MKFFKHFTDSHEGRSMQALMNEFGLEGYAAYFILMETCAKKIEKQKDEELETSHFKCVLNERVVREKLRMRSTKVELFLNSCSTLVLLQFTKVKDEFHFSIPKLLECMDRDSKRARTERGPTAPKIEDKEEDKDKDKESFREVENQPSLTGLVSVKLKSKPNTEGNRKAWDAYFFAYLDRYGIEPIKNKPANYCIADFVKRVGEQDAPAILSFYVQHNDSFYLKATHQLNLALRDAESLRTQWMKGKAITMSDVRKFEKQHENNTMVTELRAGKL
jgi:hypothetical protein